VKNKNLLVVLQYLEPGGIEWLVARQTKDLQSGSLGWKPVVFVYDQGPVKPIDEVIIQNGVSLVRRQKGSGFSFAVIGNLLKLFHQEKISVVHVHHLGALIYAVFAKFLAFRKIKIVYTQHSFIHLYKYPKYRRIEKLFCFFADEITAVSEQVQREFTQFNISRKKIHLVPNGSVFPEVKLASEEKLFRCRRDLVRSEGWSESVNGQIEKKWIVYLARIHRGKGQDLALDLWERMSESVRTGSVLLVIGPVMESDYFSELQQRAQKLPDTQRILFLPATNRAGAWMQVANVFLSCSESEGWPMAPMEALGAGVPVILSQIEGHQMYLPYSRQFELSDRKNGAALVEKELQQDFEAQRSAQWLRTEEIRRRYSVRTMNQAYLKIYEGAP